MYGISLNSFIIFQQLHFLHVFWSCLIMKSKTGLVQETSWLGKLFSFWEGDCYCMTVMSSQRTTTGKHLASLTLLQLM